MPKTNLVIVESPAKAKTIGKYLGSGYKVKASMGHLRDLPKSKIGVDLDNGFEPNYIPIKGREDLIHELESEANKSDIVFLATDPDREGEAISWHLKELLNLPDDKARRVTFNEITKKVVTESIKKPRDIDKNLVDAQQARRILDRIIGYKLSPLLWKKVRRGLSAGRVQSVVTRMVVDRENDIRAFTPEEYWILQVLLEKDGIQFKAKYYGTNGKKSEITNTEQALSIENEIKQSPFCVSDVKKTEKKRSPAPPFITSTLQQEASRRLNMTPRRTMSIAQQLYEGIEITGQGAVGLITYMRTDSLRLSEEALAAAGQVINQRFGTGFYNGVRRYKTASGAQDAHEAIRPSIPQLTPDSIKNDLTAEQYKLYKLIWSRFIACQMTNAVYDSVTADIQSKRHIFRVSSQKIKFAGFTAVYEERRDDVPTDEEEALPQLAKGDILKLEDILKEQKFTQPPARYTEATLVHAMEENGVGRPSTYASMVANILDKEYAIKKGKYLEPTPLGEVVTDLMKDKFTNIVDTEFTANMEKGLDDVEAGSKYWKDLLSDFYGDFEQQIKTAEAQLDGVRIKVPDEETEEICDLCGRKMVIKSSRFGRFLACPGYPDCKFTKPLVVEMPGKCPKCGARILKKTSKKGYTYYGCEKNPECDFMTWDVPVSECCSECGQTMFKKSGRGHKKAFCINEKCAKFVPEDKRGGYKKQSSDENKDADGKKSKTVKKTAAKGKNKNA